MALHRDIHWIGRQWAVTGFGMQAIDQRFGGKFDIAIERLWDHDLLDILRAQQWFNAADFAKGLEIARTRYPQPEARPAPPRVQRLLQASGTIVPANAAAAREKAAAEMDGPPKPAPSFFQMSTPTHSARLLRVWRVGRRR
jgi:hypothetical protein